MNVYLVCVIVLLTLAVVDLFVGVSNDAVNFLNSAIGARVAPLRVIFIVAAAGVFIGAATSGGMMDVARHGIFHPEMFSFSEVMTIFLSVVVSDVLLLDIFNNLGLPTSTTVSMVFELLGATSAFALLKIPSSEGALSVGDLMNTERAIEIIFSIFLSVVLAFFFGALVQYICRLIFTFSYRSRLKWKIGLFGGISATAIMYFLIFKGIAGMSIIPPSGAEYLQSHILPILGVCFAAFTLLFQGLYFLKADVFSILVLFGTFSLAVSFAGNDLVNFIGVSMAGLSSWQDFSSVPGADPATYMMDSLNAPARTPILFLIVSGVIMVIALMTSRKSRAVIKTSVDLARQGEGDEMFGSSRIARSLVRLFTSIGRFVDDILPSRLKAWADSRFDTSEISLRQGAAFDEVRATVNLVVASLLIALGTSLKLPLSTTYVSFMVAMGTSLADRAWGRETAVYRITGVVSVIGGWFVTAGAAFLLSFVAVLLIHWGGVIAAVVLVALVAFILIRSAVSSGKKKKDEASDTVYVQAMEEGNTERVMELFKQHTFGSEADFVGYAGKTYLSITDAFLGEKLSPLRKSETSLRRMRESLKNTRRKEMVCLRRADPSAAMRAGTWFHLGRNSCDNILYCLRRIEEPCREHVDNNFYPLDSEQVRDFVPLRDGLLYLCSRTEKVLRRQSWEEVPLVRRDGALIKAAFEEALANQAERMQKSEENLTVAYLYLNILQESREMASYLRHLIRAAGELSKS